MSDSTKHSITYFGEKGSGNTDELSQIVARRIGEGGIEAVVVATSSGRTALTVAGAVAGAVPVFAANFQSAHWDRHTRPDASIQKQAEAQGAVFMPEKPVARYLKDIDGHSPKSLYLFGQGMKVAVEVIMQAVEVGHIQPGAVVIGVGGSSRGADVAVVARAAGPDELGKLWVSEILAKPR